MIRRLLTPLVLLGAALAVYWPIFLGRSYAQRDFLLWSLGSRAVIREALRAGELALWNPYIGLGMPNIVEPLHGVFYPLHALLWFGPMVQTINLFFFLHVLLWGAGGYVLGRVLETGSLGALLSALICMLGGTTSGAWASGVSLLTGAWMPFCAAAAVHMGRTAPGSPRSIAWLALPLCMTALAGDPFQFARATLLSLVCVIGSSVGHPQLRPLLRFVGTVVLAACLAAPAILPGLLFLDESIRGGGLQEARATVWSLHPLRLIELFAPEFLGDPTDPARYLGARYFSDRQIGPIAWAYSVYLGAGTLLFAAFALKRPRAPISLALLIGAAVSLLLALGHYTPLHAMLREAFAPLRYFRYPEKYMDVVTVCVGSLAALGFRRVGERPLGPLVATMALGLAFWLPSHWIDEPSMRDALLHSASVMGAMALALLLLQRRPRWGSPALAAIVALDLVATSLPLMRWVDADTLARPPSIVAAGGKHQPPPRIHRDLSGFDWSRVSYEQRAIEGARTVVPNLGMMHGIASVPGYASAVDATYQQLWSATSQQLGKALRLFSVDHALLAHSPVDDALENPAPAPPGPPVAVYTVRDPLPRVYAVRRARLVEERVLPTEILREEVLLGHEAVVTRKANIVDGIPGRAGECRISNYEREQLDVTCQLETAGLVVLVDAWSPDWRATVDGQPTPVIRANGHMRAVRLERGHHQIRFTYRPWSVAMGLVSSLFALGVIVALISRRGAEARKVPS